MYSKIITGVLVAFAVAGVGIFYATADNHCGTCPQSAGQVVQCDLMSAGVCPTASSGCCDDLPACCETGACPSVELPTQGEAQSDVQPEAPAVQTQASK